MDVPSGGLENSPGALKFLMEMYHLMEFHDVEMDVIYRGLKTSPGALKSMVENRRFSFNNYW